MWFTIDYVKDGEHKRIVSNWQGVMAFMRMNIEAAEYREIARWVGDTFEQGYPVAGWQWANGDSFEVYCPANESLPMTVDAPVVVNPLRKVVQSVVSAIL